MFKKIFFIVLLFFGLAIQSQTKSTDYRKKIIELKKDTIQLDSVALNPQEFKIFDAKTKLISASNYSINFSKAILIIDSKKFKKITVEYFRLPDFVTKIYTPFDEKLILQNNTNQGKLYSLTTNKKKSDVKLFDGLKTRGFITRGLTSGNNQNAVTNSALDLEISGKLSKDVTLRANIFDTNIPVQNNGVSQNLTDFDRIFIEMFTDNWRVRAGDLSLKNTETFFFPFAKQVSGLEVEANVNENLKVAASGAVVRGKFNTFNFTGVEGNQGPYKIYGANNESVILMIEGSEQVYVNGSLIKRGENEDYTINYNLGEITFNTTYPITNDMRIWIDFQYAERNYTRFITYDKAEYEGEKFSIAGYFYSENDAKNQPLQQSLSTQQKEILANAGNNEAVMFSESAFLDVFDENKILYKKVTNGTQEYFEYSTNENDELYTVTFTNVGANNGDYVLDDTIATGSIFSFAGTNLGDYSPITKLVAPTKSQLLIVKSALNTTKKTALETEIAISNRDANLFSSIDDNQNIAAAAKINWEQILIDKSWKLTSKISHEYAQENFYSEQGYEPVEFNRDWNILSNNATKNYFQSALNLTNKKEDYLTYQFNNLTYNNGFKGTKHELKSKIKASKTSFFVDGSYLSNTSNLEDNSFFRAQAKAEHSLKKSWLGTFINFETNSRKDVTSNQFINTSHRFKEYEGYFGVGDTTKIFAKIGYNYRNNDSIKSNQFTEINNRKTIYIDSKLIKNKNTNLSVYANYRITENNFSDDEKALNSRVVFTQKLFQNFINLSTVYETSSGNVARQDYIYVQTEPGLGFYTWIDYNNDGIKDFNEFEIAQFQDQANYLRLPKPNLSFIATQRAKWNQSITLNPRNWATKTGIKKLISHFYNLSYLSVENEQERTANSFQLNPFDFNENSLIGLNLNIRNSLFYNKDLQKHSITFTYGNSKLKQQYFIGNQENNINLHQLDYAHKFADFWLIDLMVKTSLNTLETENFTNRNYEIDANEIQPKISFLYNENNRFSAFYHFKNKQNKLEDFETLHQQKFGVEYFYISKKKNQISANINVFLNDFTGDANTPVAYQMLEGLQAGKNYTWSLLFNRKLNSFLNLNLNYLGRKSENSKTIHTGSVQLRATF
ncbi:hypothetical protein BW723_07655 [Polaribacter reichenbachii]|uniref:Uncharacterized protein n=1 Tax=Polaribacter reichenbachii TaxID=996801 RepID=A0A1B8U6C9_9FLAO|nr:hypothetical protein [Polaribacter reichenbachii]APZ46179.1 hypothetical protein BW723_07655 [Polaribacter reichenbachii]AUC20041.1 hypothetical protein BTO17_15675 [Polaribacter reichenbachii]OBY67411.1 hypothetical protein LPB301_01835 [Polaribacter reichenbachii]